MKIDVHHFHHFDFSDSANEKLDRIIALIQSQGAREMQELETLKSKVQETTTVEESAITLLNGLSAQLAASKTDPAAIQALADQLSAESASLAAAVTANTPAA